MSASALQFWTVFFWDAFLGDFCQHPLLPLEIGLVLILIGGWFGREYGLPLLFWHETWWKQGIVGVALALLLGKIAFVGYLLDTKRGDNRQWTKDMPFTDELLSYFAGFFVVLVAICLLLGLIRLLVIMVGRRRSSSQQPTSFTARVFAILSGWPMVGGILLGMMLNLLLVQFAEESRGQAWLREMGKMILGLTTSLDPSEAKAPALHALATIFLLLLVAVYSLLGLDHRGLIASPAISLFTLLGGLAAIYGYFAFRVPAPFFFGCILVYCLLWLGGIPSYKLRFPNLEKFYASLADLSRYVADGQPSSRLLRTDDIRWRGPSKPGHHSDGDGGRRPLAVVCVSGGGLRAASWTAAMLQELEVAFQADNIAFPYHVRLITGASGGMAGAAYYTATLNAPDEVSTLGYHSEPDPQNANVKRPLTLDQLADNVSRDCLTPVVHRLIYGDLLTVFCPVAVANDRGRILEQTWKKNLHGALDRKFQELAAGEAQGWRASLIFSPMLVEDGRRLLISNLDLHDLAVNTGNILQQTDLAYSRTALELYRLFADAHDFLLSTAVRMSASFPYASPAAELPTKPRRRVVDAGYYDNFGVSLAASWVYKNRRWLAENASGVVLIQIRDGLSEANRLLATVDGTQASSPLERGMEWLTSPPAALLNARESVATFRNDEQLMVLTQYFDDMVGDLFFTTAAFEFAGEASLSWYLTKAEKQAIQQCATRLGQSKEMQELKKWWKGHTPP